MQYSNHSNNQYDNIINVINTGQSDKWTWLDALNRRKQSINKNITKLHDELSDVDELISVIHREC